MLKKRTMSCGQTGPSRTGPDVRVGFKPGEKKNAAYDKNDSADFIENRIDGFPTKFGL